MNNQERELYLEKYNERTHLYGRIGLTIGIAMLLIAPFLMGVSLDAMPNIPAFWKGFAQIAIVYIPSCIVEFLIYTPMLGAGGSYLAFITGNLINMKIPCALNARDIVGTKAGTRNCIYIIHCDFFLSYNCSYCNWCIINHSTSSGFRGRCTPACI